jgi:hypothetical protein
LDLPAIKLKLATPPMFTNTTGSVKPAAATRAMERRVRAAPLAAMRYVSRAEVKNHTDS